MTQNTQTPPTKPKNNNGWTEERRRKQAERIKDWKPWEQSTGPKSLAGKRISRFNALKTGSRSQVFRDCAKLLTMNEKMIKEFNRLLYKMAYFDALIAKKRTKGKS